MAASSALEQTHSVMRLLHLGEVGPREWQFEFPRLLPEVHDRFDEALECMDQGELRRAEGMLQPLVDEFPEFIDARHHLALVLDETRRPAKALREWERAVTTGLAALPPTFSFEQDKLEWSWLDNRPFLRAYAGLGTAHQGRGLTGEAFTIFENLLNLNPSDNQGVRALAIDCSLASRRPLKALELCERYLDCGDEYVLFGRALALHRLGRQRESRSAAKAALASYPLVGEELLKSRHPRPRESTPGYVTMGGADQAYYYWHMFGKHWEEYPGALELLKPRS